MKLEITLTVEINEHEIADKYPNFRWNYANNINGYKEFSKLFIPEFVYEDTWDKFGFRIKASEPIIIEE